MLTRRSFLGAGGAALTGAAARAALGCRDKRKRRVIPGPEAAPPLAIRGTVVGPGQYVRAGRKHCLLSILDLDAAAPAPRHVPMTFFGHGVSPHPIDPARAVVFEKHGPGACEVDLRAGAVTRPITTTPTRQFYGHGAWTADGGLLYATETVLATARGVIVVRDGTTFQPLGELDTHGTNPHDCALTGGGRVLAITNGGGDANGPAPTVTYVDVESRKLVDKVEIPAEHLNAGHLVVSPRGDLVVVSAQRHGLPDDAQGGVSIRPAGGAMHTVSEPREVVAGFRGEVLSASIHVASGVVGATNPRGERVTFWRVRDRGLVATVRLPQTRGIGQTLDRERFLVSYGPRASLIEIDAETLEPIAGSGVANAGLSGSHFIVHHLAA